MNLFASWFRSLIADLTPILQDYNVADPTAMGNPVRILTLAFTPGSEESPESVISLFWKDAEVKVFEKRIDDEVEARQMFSAMSKDLEEAQSLAKSDKIQEAQKLLESLFQKYSSYTDPVIDSNPTPVTTTNASMTPPELGAPVEEYLGWKLFQLPDGSWIGTDVEIAVRGETIDEVKSRIDESYRRWGADRQAMKKEAKIVMQNLFFDSPEEAMEFQEKMKKLQEGKAMEQGEGAPLWEQTGEEPASDEEALGDEELAPPSMSYEQVEKQRADETKNLDKRIEKEVKDQINSALESKKATLFTDKDKELVEAMRGVGRTWEEITEYLRKTLKYDEDSVAMFIDEMRKSEEGPSAPVEEPIEDEKPLPEPPRPPEDLVSPETHDKLLEELPKEEPLPEPEPTPEPIEEETMLSSAEVVSEIDRADNSEIRKVALNPLQEPPAPKMEAPVEEPPMTPADEPELESPTKGDRVYVMGDYDANQEGFEGTMVSDFKQKGDRFAVVESDDGELHEVALHRVVKASQRDLTVESTKNEDVIRMFVNDSFPKDKRPIWGTEHLKITKQPFGWALVNYATPILYRSNHDPDLIYFNTDKYSVTTTRLQNKMRAVMGGGFQEVTEEGMSEAINTNPNLPHTDPPHEHVEEPKVEEPMPETPAPAPEHQELRDLKNSLQALQESLAKVAAGEMELAEEPQESDIVIFDDHGMETAVCDGKVIAQAKDREELDPMIKAWMEKNNYSPDIWWMSDHGNMHRTTLESALKLMADETETPISFKPYKIAPPHTDREKAVPASPELSEAFSRLESVEHNLAEIENLKKEVQARLAQEIKRIEEQNQRAQLDAEYRGLIDKIAVLLDAVDSKTVSYKDHMYKLVQEDKEVGPKVTDKMILERVMEKVSGVSKLVEDIKNGFKALAKSVTQKTVVRFPRKMSKLDKQASAMDELQALHDKLMSALQLLSEPM